jgi:ABC-type multidrug transport system ATPase subunit
VRRAIGYLPQEFGFYPRFTVREFVEYMAWLKEMPGRDVPGAVQRAVERVGLADRADDRLRTLSGGMLRRAGIAQAIVNDPRILLLDEPTVGLDPEQRLDFRALLRELGVDGCVVVSTHLVEDVVAACGDVVLLECGRLVFQGTPADLESAGAADGVGDSRAERGYTVLLRNHRGGTR